MYKNSEGYNDPTAGVALGRVMKEYKKERREVWRRQTELKERPKVYIVSRYAGDIENNVKMIFIFTFPKESIIKNFNSV